MICKADAGLVGTALLGVNAVRGAVQFCVLLCRLSGNSQAVDAKVVADTIYDQERPASVYYRGEDEVEAEIPQFEVGRHGTEGCTGNGEVWVIYDQRASDHRYQHDRPVWERLVGQMGQNNLCRHAAEDQRHGQAV